MADVLCPVVVGRAAELGVLRAALGAAADGAGGVVFLSGEAGIGKSRLVREVADEARARDVAVVAGRAVPGGAGTPYRPLTGRCSRRCVIVVFTTTGTLRRGCLRWGR
jgi:predicted ATPase